MTTFFLFIDLFTYIFFIYLFYLKKELVILYLPVLTFANTMIEPVLPAFLYYGAISSLLIYCILQNRKFYKYNISALLLFIYFLILLPAVRDLELIRPNVFSVLTFFISIPLIYSVYLKHTRETIFKELSNAALLILVLFVVNVLVSTKLGYSPFEMYGITHGVLYGDLYGANFNILAIAVYLTVMRQLEYRKTLELLILIVSVVFILLSLRRSVMLITAIAIVVPFLSLLSRLQIKRFILFGSFIFLIGYGIYSSTSFMNNFQERYEERKLDERSLEEEKRFMEYELLYNDMFIHNRYSPWFGYELFNSAGNYGEGYFEYRTLHSDLTSIAHSSGLLGLLFYISMILTAFKQSFKAAFYARDKLITLFCALALAIFTMTGRYTESGAMMLLFFVLLITIAKDHNSELTDLKTSN